MKQGKQLRELAALTEVIFSAQSAKMQKLMAQQGSLKAKYAELCAQEEKVQAQFSQDPGLRMAQTDVLWRVWLGRQKAAVNAELALLAVEKERTLEELRVAFGRRDVAAALARQDLFSRRPGVPSL